MVMSEKAFNEIVKNLVGNTIYNNVINYSTFKNEAYNLERYVNDVLNTHDSDLTGMTPYTIELRTRLQEAFDEPFIDYYDKISLVFYHTDGDHKRQLTCDVIHRYYNNSDSGQELIGSYDVWLKDFDDMTEDAIQESYLYLLVTIRYLKSQD